MDTMTTWPLRLARWTLLWPKKPFSGEQIEQLLALAVDHDATCGWYSIPRLPVGQPLAGDRRLEGELPEDVALLKSRSVTLWPFSSATSSRLPGSTWASMGQPGTGTPPKRGLPSLPTLPDLVGVHLRDGSDVPAAEGVLQGSQIHFLAVLLPLAPARRPDGVSGPAPRRRPAASSACCRPPRAAGSPRPARSTRPTDQKPGRARRGWRGAVACPASRPRVARQRHSGGRGRPGDGAFGGAGGFLRVVGPGRRAATPRRTGRVSVSAASSSGSTGPGRLASTARASQAASSTFRS